MNHKLLWRCALSLAVLLLLATEAAAVDSEVGHLILKQECSRCHAVDVTGASPLPPAPPFRDIARRYPPSNLTEALAEGIVTGHNDMPEFEFTPEEISAITGYLETLREQ